MEDKDQSFSYSSIVSVITYANKMAVSVYPKPVTGDWVRIDHDQLTGAEIRLFNAQGVQMNYNLRNSRLTSKELEIGGLPAGVYLLRITQGNQVTVKSFLVIR